MSRNDYWFKRKRYGYGWVPVTWQGWLTIFVYLSVILGTALATMDAPGKDGVRKLVIYLTVVLLATGALAQISYYKGPRPKWRWGNKSGDKPSEDY